MKTAAFRTLSLTLMLTVVTGLGLRQRVATAAPAGGAVTAGEFLVDPPTLINLGFEWFVQGDDNRNASVDVSYRKQGATDWKPALPLLRLQGERIRQGDQLDVTSPNMFAGSILDLEPATAYEARFALRDPDGRPSAGEGRRHRPRACRCLQVQPLRIYERSCRESHDTARRDVLPAREGH